MVYLGLPVDHWGFERVLVRKGGVNFELPTLCRNPSLVELTQGSNRDAAVCMFKITHSVRCILGSGDGDDPLEQVGFRDQINFHIFWRLLLELRELLDCCE